MQKYLYMELILPRSIQDLCSEGKGEEDKGVTHLASVYLHGNSCDQTRCSNLTNSSYSQKTGHPGLSNGKTLLSLWMLCLTVRWKPKLFGQGADWNVYLYFKPGKLKALFLPKKNVFEEVFKLTIEKVLKRLKCMIAGDWFF